jgi:para-aminobenzoate synthetase component 1
MPAQEVAISLTPAELLLRWAAEPGVFGLDGGGPGSWGFGKAVLGFGPLATLRVDGAGEGVVHHGGGAEVWRGDPFALGERFQHAYGPAADSVGTPRGAVVAALSYDLRRWVERSPARTADPLGLPLLYAAAYDWVLSYAYGERRWVVESARRTTAELRDLAAALRAAAHARVPPQSPRPVRTPQADLSCAQYCAAVRAVHEYIAAGDVYQVNLAQRFTVQDPPVPWRLFAAWQQHPMPFAAYVDGGDFTLVSNSPECLLALHGRDVATFPIKGTRERGADVRSDQALARALADSPKDRAEHIMIVDLERNDLGRVCRTGSVRVEELARVYTYPSLHHMVSTVRGELTPSATLADVLRAIFPGGSITGAPKVRAMEIIDELEPVARGFYTGAIGYLGADGSARFSLLIRSAIAARGMLTYHAGGGIVADSVAMREYEETLLKAQAFFAALAAA